MSQQKFRLTGKYTRNFGIMSGVGLVLLILGYVLSTSGGSGEGDHGGDHGDQHEVGAHDGAHSDAGTGEVFQYVNDQNGHGDGDHDGDSHDGDGHDGDGHDGDSHDGDSHHGDDHAKSDGEHDAGHDSEAHHGDEHGEGEDHAAVGGADHGDGHGGAHAGEHGGGHHAEDHIQNGTWRRAKVYPEQYTMVHHDKEVTPMSLFGASILGGTFFWFIVALFGVFFIAVGYLANAGWYIIFKRILENYYRFLPIAGVLLLVTFFVFGDALYEWYHLEVGVDKLIDGKRGFLNVVFILITMVLLIAAWTFLGHLFKKASLKEESEGGLTWYNKSMRYSAIFMPLFALGFVTCSFLWIMSIDAHWFSTIFGVYCFAGLFVSGMTITMFISVHLHDKGHIKLSGNQMHDVGKFMFAFSVFWAYIWVSQYLLIWYANIPEETVYYYQRLENYQLLFALNVVINFVFPFIALMTRKAKREFASLRSVGRVMLVGRFLDIYLLIAPGVLGSEGGMAPMMMMFGAFLLIGGVFLWVVFKGFEDAPLLATKHPYYQESIHHDTGV
ncbi:MAG: hypothetical protein AAF998_09925 [Bacteroidota bacterium]